MAQPYISAPIPEWEAERLADLHALGMLDTEPEETFDRLTALAADLFSVPIALISLVDADRQWFKAACGLGTRETSRDESFCGHAILEDELLVVPDARLDPRFAHNPMVLERPSVRFYAGAVLRGPRDMPIGTLCLIAHEPRHFTEADRRRLLGLARIAEDELQGNMRSTLLEAQAHLDPLTELPSAAFFRAHVGREIGEGAKSHFALWAIELRSIPLLRQALGDAAADAAVVECSRRLVEACGPEALITRSGVADFLVFRPFDPGEHPGELLATCLDPLHEPLELTDSGIRHTLSSRAGFAICPDHGEDPEVLITKARMALLRAAEPGPGFTISAFDSERDQHLLRRNELCARLPRALERQELSLVYQAKADLRTGRMHSVEALLRWRDADLGSISPADFIPLAESMGLIAEIGSWVISEACRQAQAWAADGVPPLRVAVNVASTQLSARLVETTQQALASHQLAADRLEFELTESSLIQQGDAAARVLDQLKELGIRSTIDDFGTGYSSLAYLNRLPVSCLKIDQSFIRDMTEDAESAKIVQAIIALAHALDLKVVAEGVETPEQVVYLRAYGCDEVQGYLIGRPVVPDQIPELARAASLLPGR